MNEPRLSLPLRWPHDVPAPQAAPALRRAGPRVRTVVCTQRDARHLVRGALLLQRHGAAAERWGWPGMAALGCAALSLLLWVIHPAPAAAPPSAAATASPSSITPVHPAATMASAEAAAAQQRPQDLESLASWFDQHALQWRAATYQWAAVPGEPGVWTVDALLQGKAADLDAALARLPQAYAHLRVDDLRLSQGPGQQLQARLRLQLRYRPTPNATPAP